MTPASHPESSLPGPIPHMVGVQFKPAGIVHEYDSVVLRHNVSKQTTVVRRAEDGVEVEVTLEDLVEKRVD